MSITDLTSIQVESERPNFDRFKMDKNEKARILVPSTRIAQFYVHVFHTDTPKMKEMPNGRTREIWDTASFGGMYICKGDPSKVARSPRFGDPDNCPACAAAADSSRPRLIEQPKKTFAMNIIQYVTRPNSYDVRNNNVQVKVWKHGDPQKIQPIQLAAQQTDLRKVDFLVESDNTEWKKLSINVALDGPAYAKDADLKDAVEELIKNELYTDDVLVTACGSDLPAEELQMEVDNLFRQFSTSVGDVTSDSGGFDGPSSLDEEVGISELNPQELNSLLD